MSLGIRYRYGKQFVTLPYTHDREDADVQTPAFLLNLVSGVQAQKDELDKQINQHLKSGLDS